MANSATINVILNPVLDTAKFNVILNTLQNAFSTLKPIDTAKLTQGLASVKSNFVGLVTSATSFDDTIKKATDNVKKFSESGSLASKAFNFTNIVNSVSIISNAFGQIAQAGMDFESDLKAVGAITGFAGKELDVLGESARKLAKDFGGTASEQLKSFQGILSKLGPEMAQDSEALALYAKNVNILSQASGDDAATSMSALTDSLLQMGLASGTPAQIAEQSTKAINVLAASAQVGAAEIPQVASALLATGVAAKGANMSLVDVNAAIQVLAVGGKTGAEAGTALRNVLGLLQKASGPAEGAMKKMGTSSAELGKILTTQGLDVALAKLQTGMNGLGSDAEKNAALMEIFGTENAAAAGILMQNADKFQTFKDGIEKGTQGIGSAYEQAATRMDSASNIVERVKAKFNDVFIGISQFAGQGVTALLGAATQIAPLMMSLGGISQLIPEGTFTRAALAMKSYGATILSYVVPGLVTQDISTKSLVFNTEALTLANIKNRISGLAEVAMNYIRSTSLYQVATAQMSLNAAMSANPIGAIIIAVTALVGALYLLYTNSETVRNFMNSMFSVMKTAFTYVWEIIKNAGSAIATFGSLIWNVAIVPFKIWWSVMSAIGNTILDLLGLNGKATDSFSTMQKILNWLADAFHYVMLGIEAFKAVIEGVIAYIGSMVDSVSTGIKQLFSLDFGGLWDTITGAGDKAANAFSEKFNEKMRAANGLDIQAKINVETNNKQLVTEYEETSKKISDLLSIKSSQGLTKEQQADLDALQKKASETGAKIAQIAPEAVNSFKGITDANGKITDSYDINIDKAKEFANANNFSGVFEEQKNRVSKNLTEMAQTYGSQVQQMETYRQQLQQPIENEEEYAKLKDKFSETKKKAEEMKNALLDSFGQAGEAGLLTDGAIQSVAKSLKVTEKEAREMLLAKELKKVAESGVYTEKQIEAIANKYGVTKEKAIELLNASKGQTKEVEKTEQKVKDLAEAWGKVKSAIEAASSKSLADYQAAKLYSQYLKENPELAKKMYESQDENGKAMFDRLKQMSDEERANYINNLLEKGKADNKISKTINADAKKAEQDITGEKEKQSKSDKQSTTEKQSQYEIAKALLDTETKSKLADLDKEESKKRQFNYENDIVLTEKAKNLEQLKSIENQKTIYESQLKQAEINSKLAKTDKERSDAANVISEINKTLDMLKENSSEIKYKIRLNDSEALKQLPTALRNLQTEADKYGGVAVKASVDITQQTIDNLNTEITDLEKEIPDIQKKIDVAITSGDNEEYLKQANELNKIYEQINKNREQIGTLQIEKEFGLQYNNLLKIDNIKERSHQKELIDLNKKYKEDLLKATGNEYQKAELTSKFLADKYALEQKYIEETQTVFQKSLNPSALLADWKSAFDGVNFFSDVNTDNTALTDISKQQDDLKASYKDGSVAYASYIDQMNDLDKKRTEEVKKQSNAQSRILRAFSESIAKYTQIQISKYEEERNKYVSEQQKRYDAKAKLESDLASIDDKNSAKAIALKSQIAQNELEINNARIEADTNLYNQMGYNLMNYVAQGKSAFKSLVLSSLDMLYGKFMMALPDIFIQSISWLGPIAGPIVAGGLTATLTGLYAAAKQGVSKLKFWKGGLIPGGQQDITVNELGQEFVVNHKALMKGNNLKDLIAINRDNISIEEYAKRNYASYRTEQNAYNNYLDNKILKQGFAELKQEIRNVAVQTRRNVGLEVKLDTDKMIEATILKHNQKVGRF